MARREGSRELRLILVYAVRLLVLAFAGWVAFAPAALPDAHAITRMGLVAVLLVLSILIGEVDRQRMQFDALLQALRRATGRDVDGAGAAAPSDEAVPILIRALASRDADVREKAHKNLVRLTGQAGLPPERAAWERWWAAQAATGEEGPRS